MIDMSKLQQLESENFSETPCSEDNHVQIYKKGSSFCIDTHLICLIDK